MGLWQDFKNWVTGYDAENAAAAAAADETSRRLATEAYSLGGRSYTPENWEAVQAGWTREGSFSREAAEAEIDKAFDEGWREGQENVASAIKGTINKVVGGPLVAILSGIPAWVWIVGLLYLAWTFGLLRNLIPSRK